MAKFSAGPGEGLPLRQKGPLSFRVGGARRWRDAAATLTADLLAFVTTDGEDHVFNLNNCEMRTIEGEPRSLQLYNPAREEAEQLSVHDEHADSWREWKFALERSALCGKRASISQLSAEQHVTLSGSDDDAGGGVGGTAKAENCSVVFRSRRMSSEGAITVAQGSLQHFGITARDAEGHHRETGGDNFKVEATLGSRVAQAQVRDNQNGTYSVTYTVPQMLGGGRRVSMRRPPRKAPPTAVDPRGQENLTRMGFLVKSDPKGRSWKRRWFVLDVRKQTLSYFKTRRSRKPKGVIELCPRGRPVQMSANPHPNATSRHILQVITPRRTYNLCASSPQQIDFWFTEISSTLRQGAPALGRGPPMPGRGPPTSGPQRGQQQRGVPMSPPKAAADAPARAAPGAQAPMAAVQPAGTERAGLQLSIAVSLEGVAVRGSPFLLDVEEVYRPRGASLAAEMQSFQVTLPARGPLGLGLESSGEPPNLMLEVTSVNEGGSAWESGAIEAGDMIFAVEGVEVSELEFADVISLLKSCQDSCSLQIGRYMFDEMLPDLTADELAAHGGAHDSSSEEEGPPDLMDIVANPQRRPQSARRADGADKRWGAIQMPPPWASMEDMVTFAQWHRDQAAFVLGPLQANSAQQGTQSAWQQRLAQWQHDSPASELSMLRNALASSDFSERVAVCGLLDRVLDSEAEMQARERAKKAWSSATTSMSAVLKFQRNMHSRIAGKPAAVGAAAAAAAGNGAGAVLSPRERREQRQSQRLKASQSQR